MTLPTGQISVTDIEAEVGISLLSQEDLSFLNDFILPAIKPGSPNLGSFQGLRYFQNNTAGNCNNGGSSNCNCNCGNQPASYDQYGNVTSYRSGLNCHACTNCGPTNCVNCDTQSWLQTGNCNQQPAPVYNCDANVNCFSYDCNCSKIICTKLFDIGLMKQSIFEADQAFGERLKVTNPDVYLGYIAWAEIVVDWMSGKGPNMLPWLGQKGQETTKKWAIDWAYDIATPWAEEMAYSMNKKETGSITGKMLSIAGLPICKAVGLWQKYIGPSKKPAGFIKGFSLVLVFVIFKLIVKFGKLIEKVK